MKTVTDFLQVVLDQSQQAFKKNEIPVGAVIYDPKKMTLISKAHNKELSSKDPTSHAEILCIRKACKKLNQKRLDGLIMITYLEPCDMCKEVIKSARIKEVRFVFSNQNPSRKTIKKIYIKN
jgi:tRNA(adenine34) deaminase